MSKIKLFVENFLVYGIGGIISKIIPFVMVPVVTRLVPSPEYFGLSDLSGTITSFCCALSIFGMYDAMFRMFFEKEEREYKKNVCSTTLLFCLTLSFCVFILMILLRRSIAQFFFRNQEYAYLIYITATATLVGATNGIISAPTRMQNKRKIFLVTNALSPIISYTISIPLLLRGHYLIALLLGGMISSITMETIFWILNRSWFDFRKFDVKLLKQMLLIAVPLVPNFIIYWIFNSSDRVMIANLLDVTQVGIYSVGSKLGHASQLIYTAFAGGWQYFAFSTMNEGDQVKTNSLVFEYLGIISFLCTMFICIISRPLYAFLFPPEYMAGYIISPYLFLAPLLQMLFQVAANQFLVVKNTWPNMLILFSGAVLNVLLNLLLIPAIGIEGAALATLAGYFISDVICMFVLCKMRLMRVSVRFCAAVLLTGVFMLMWRFALSERLMLSLALFICGCVCFGLLYMKDIRAVLQKKRIKNGK